MTSAPMEHDSALPAIPLIDRLRQCAQLWIDAEEVRTYARLGRTVINDGGFFARLEIPGATTTAATLEKFARFLSEADQWPGGTVPAEVCAFAHVVGVYSQACDPSPDKGCANIGRERAA